MPVARGNVAAPPGTVSGVGSPTAPPATGPINLGAIINNFLGPLVNGGKNAQPVARAAGPSNGQGVGQLPVTKSTSWLPLAVAAVAVVVLVRWAK